MKYKIVAHIKIAPCRLGDSEINSERRFGLECLMLCMTIDLWHTLFIWVLFKKNPRNPSNPQNPRSISTRNIVTKWNVWQKTP